MLYLDTALELHGVIEYQRASNSTYNLHQSVRIDSITGSTVGVTGIQGDMVTVDGNHPLAGEHLNFEVEITEVREATQEELEHGHVHGAGGHHH